MQVLCVANVSLCSALTTLIPSSCQSKKAAHLSLQVYKILLGATAVVQPVSCDEAFLDVTGLGDPEVTARTIRADILRETGCTASAGISHNMLLARLATKAGKPDGQHRLEPDQVGSWPTPSQSHCSTSLEGWL